MRHLQFVWFWSPGFWEVGFERFTEESHGAWRFVYEWRLALGPLEIRKRADWRAPWV